MFKKNGYAPLTPAALALATKTGSVASDVGLLAINSSLNKSNIHSGVTHASHVKLIIGSG